MYLKWRGISGLTVSYFGIYGVYRKIGIPVRNYFAFNIEASAMS